MKLKIIPIPAYQDNYIWILHNDKHATVVDPGLAAPVDDYLAKHNLTLSHIMITHHHWDHINGMEELQAHWNCTVYAPIDSRIPGNLTVVKEGQLVDLPELNLTFQVIETPGHTLSHICYFNEQALFCGDTLFSIGCGRMFEGDATQYVNSLNKIKALSPETAIYCGHEYTLSNIGFALSIEPKNQGLLKLKQDVIAKREKNQPSLPALLQQELKLNPFLRTNDPVISQALSTRLDMEIDNEESCFANLRASKDQF